MERVIKDANLEGTYKAGHYNSNGDVRSPNLPMLSEQFKRLGIDNLNYKENILDVGCGNGRVWQLFPMATIDAIDAFVLPDKRFLRNGIEYQKKDFNSFLPKIKYGLILMIGCLYLMENKDAVLLKCKSILSENGSLLVLENTTRLYSDSEDGRYYNIVELCRRTDIKIVDSVLIDNIEMKRLSM